MALKITSITLDNIRGYKHLSLDELGNLVIIVGPNAVGKTNVIEAIQLLTSASSFRKPSWTELVSWDNRQGYALIHLEEDKRHLEHRLVAAALHVAGARLLEQQLDLFAGQDLRHSR